MMKKPTLWLLHGAVGMAADWREHARIFTAAGYATRCVDLWRYHECRSPDLWETGRLINAEADACEGPQVIVGYSLGGRIALHALLENETLWKAAVIVSAHPGLSNEDEKRERLKTDAEWSARCLRGDWSDFLDEWSAQDVLRGEEPEWGDRKMLEPRRGAVARAFNQWSLGGQDDLRGRLCEVTLPMLWLTGAKDAKFDQLAREACARMNSARHDVMEDAGHRLPWDNADAFCRKVMEFLGVLEGRGAF